MFKKMRGIRLPYDDQGDIFFTCKLYDKKPLDVQQKINNLCTEVGGEHYQALRDVVITHKSIREIAIERHVCETVLYTLRRRFYERW